MMRLALSMWSAAIEVDGALESHGTDPTERYALDTLMHSVALFARITSLPPTIERVQALSETE